METVQLTPAQLEALRILGALTRGHCQIYDVCGPHNAKHRARMVSLLTGTKTPQAKAGVTVLEKAFFELAGIDNTYQSLASKTACFEEWAKKTLSA